jgi:transcriptional regulator with PAS, ATPase and Fis domain
MSVDRDFNSADGIVGVSHFAERIRRRIMKIAPHFSTVLITGPSGTGKELIARAIHVHSPRVDKPFIAVDCAGVTGPLFAGHLFGHVKGAFTGAEHMALGCFRAADGGSVFLDEIGELDRDLQGKLLRVLQERVVTPLGSHAAVPVDVRVIAATNRNLEQMIDSGHFREDLYYRLNVVSVKAIPLKDRLEDIAPLTQYFLQKIAGRLGALSKELSRYCSDCMLRHDWPGNVRELENFLEQAVLISSERMIRPDTVSDVPNRTCICPIGASLGRRQRPCLPLSDGIATAAQAVPTDTTASVVLWPTLAQLELDHIQRTLERTGYNQSAAADLLGLHRQQLLRKIKKYRLDSSSSRPGRPNKPPKP